MTPTTLRIESLTPKVFPYAVYGYCAEIALHRVGHGNLNETTPPFQTGLWDDR